MWSSRAHIPRPGLLSRRNRYEIRILEGTDCLVALGAERW